MYEEVYLGKYETHLHELIVLTLQVYKEKGFPQKITQATKKTKLETFKLISWKSIIIF